MPYETAVKVAAGFGGGMGGVSVCGAVAGAFMAIGLKYGGTNPEASGRMVGLLQEFAERFKALHPSVNCHDLLGCDVLSPEGRQTARDKNLFDTVCKRVVSDAATLVQEFLSRELQQADG